VSQSVRISANRRLARAARLATIIAPAIGLSAWHLAGAATADGDASAAAQPTGGSAQAATPALVAQNTTAAPRTAATAAASEGSSDELVEVIVTASRHAEDVQKESRPLDVLTADDLQRNGVNTANALNSLVPGLSVGNSADQLQVYIRGVGDRTVTAQTDPGVAFDYDGVYLPRAWESVLTFFDDNRLEVLKGPQGTLYGRNSAAGALNVVPNLPTFNGVSGDVEAQFGNYSDRLFSGAVNLPLNNVFAMRLSFQTDNHSGYLNDNSNDADNQAGRVQFLFQPNEDFSARLDSTLTHNGGHGQSFVAYPLVNPSNPWISLNNPTVNGAITGPPFFISPLESNNYQSVRTWINLLDIEWKLSGATLTVIPAFVDGNESSLTYPIISDQETTTSKQSSIEIRLASSDQGAPLVPGLQWVLGVFGSHEQLSEVTVAGEGHVLGNLITAFPKLNDTTGAAFAEGKYSLLNDLRVIGGVRYTSEQKVAAGSTTANPYGDLTYPNAATSYFNGTKDMSAVNYRAGLEYDLAPQTMAYFTASTGFKAGGFFAAPPPNTYEPEKLTAYELGIKSRMLDNRLQVDVELFDWDYKNLQEQFIAVLSSGGVGLVTHNAAQSTLRGVDVSASALLTQDDLFMFETEYNHAVYGNYEYDTLFLGPPATGCIATEVPTDHLDCSGMQLVRAPTWTGSADYRHTFRFANGTSLAFDIQEHLSSSYWLADDFTPNERAPGYAITNVVATYSFSQAFDVSLYANNLENRAIYNYAVQSPAAPSFSETDISPPRTYGVRLLYRF
jgi:iron complex outermembrane recepter protein